GIRWSAFSRFSGLSPYPKGGGACAAPQGPFSGHFSGCDADSGRGVPYDMGVIRLAEKGFEWICHG
ncbi:hypothetical protein, partial [Escherichia coli]|uniref:hypothetical protein n=1 Tax=Escherichia coli TaxID=562 RepID=UPI0028748E34